MIAELEAGLEEVLLGGRPGAPRSPRPRSPLDGAQYYDLNAPIVGMAPTPDGGGYWMVGSDGGVFASGDAQFYGSTGSLRLNEPIVGMTATPDDMGYWFTASDGGVFNYGSAGFDGSLGGSGVTDIAGMSLGL